MVPKISSFLFFPPLYFLSTSGYVATLRLKRMPPSLSPGERKTHSTAIRLCFQRKESPVDPLSKSRHPVMLPLQIILVFLCQSPIIRLCCHCESRVGVQYFVKVPSSSGYVVALQTMCGFNILSKSHHPVMLLHCKPCVDSIFCLKVPSSGYVVALQTMCGFNICQSPIIRLCYTTIGRDGVRLCIFVPTSRHPVNVPSEGRSCCVMCNQFPFPCIISVIYFYSSKYHHPVALQ